MPTYTVFRYQLEPYTGSKSRMVCPACGKPRCFTRYIDTYTGELLPIEFGRCDHEISCGYFRHPYKRGGYQSVSYGSQQGNSHAIYVNQGYNNPIATPALIPLATYQASLGHYEQNNLARLLQARFGEAVASSLCSRFHLGTSSYWPGACVFWLIDERNQVRGGQVVLYDETGHTVKSPYRHTTWAHTALTLAYEKQGISLPGWLTDYATRGQKSPSLFGLPQLSNEPLEKPIAIVESAKTAMLATPYLSEYIWLATMGLSYLTESRLAPLRKRRIVLFPDAGALEQWNTKANELRQKGFNISIFEALEKLLSPDERKAGLDLADIILREAPSNLSVLCTG